jgi:tetratricopeptide (TPR) repeat protein
VSAAPRAEYTARQAAHLAGLSLARLRGLMHDRVLSPERGPRGEYRFCLQDVLLLRTAGGLGEHVPFRRLRRALRRLRGRLPHDRPLSGLRLTAVGEDVVMREGERLWDVASGQGVLDFDAPSAPQTPVSALIRRNAPPSREEGAQAWYRRGVELEAADPERARDAYRRALELDPEHPAASVNLGRLLHEKGEVEAAESHYRRALRRCPNDPVAAFNLGVALEDLGRVSAAVDAYRRALRADPRCAEAHFNLSWIYERTGHRALAFRHLTAYKKLMPT